MQNACQECVHFAAQRLYRSTGYHCEQMMVRVCANTCTALIY
ncbi:hypothetical protein M514_17969 [Trichuris suis]|uniref:Uncharacterized protein n=1 Tax=Trichuris suis TaxID=68888 RepID=A0A085NK51_9BILA|nr:hypothetical protein M514_17969 [Trichuris suis]